MKPVTSMADADACMKCGFCMSSCPIYKVDHIESHVARGRNMLIRGTGNGLPKDKAYAERLSYCLLCGRCEAVCPARVASASINIAARTGMMAEKGLPLMHRLLYRVLLKNRSLLARLLGIAQKIPGLSASDGKPLRYMADALSVLSRGISIPKLSKPFLAKRLPAITHPSRELKVRGQVAVFPGCAFEFFFADIGESIVRDLAAAGYDVIYPQELTCCGLAVRSTGDLKTAQQMAQRNISILAPYDRIVTGCATCSSALKNYASWFPHDAEWQQKSAALAAKVSDLAEFMAVEGFKPQPVEPVIVTYHDPCHMKWLQGIYDQPRELLRSIEGLKYVEMEGADECCGLGGAFSITHRDTSLAIQAKKMQSIRNTGASIVATSCPGCIVQLRDGVRRHNLNVEVMHISQLLDGQKGLPQRRRSAAAVE